MVMPDGNVASGRALLLDACFKSLFRQVGRALSGHFHASPCDVPGGLTGVIEHIRLHLQYSPMVVQFVADHL